MRFAPVLVAALAMTGALPPTRAAAQKDAKEPQRPRLVASADTNDSHAYYDFGVAMIERDPQKAADAFYWSARLNPLYADAFFARRVALHLTDVRRLDRYWDRDRRTIESPEVRRIDSLYYTALTLNPFVSQRLERYLGEAVQKLWVDEMARRYNVTSSEVQYEIDKYRNQLPPYSKALLAYYDGDFEKALDQYAKAIKQAKRKSFVRTQRARLFFQLDRGDSALVELGAAVEEMRKEDKKDLVYVYESKAIVEHSIGMIQYRLGNVAAARESFAKALEEDLSYYPAHVQLAYMALETKDTTAALNEMDLAVQIKGDDPGVRYVYGYTLAHAGKYTEAETQLRKAVELDPIFPLPHHMLGQVLEMQNKNAEALASYKTFLALAPQSDTRRDEMNERIRELGATQQGASKP